MKKLLLSISLLGSFFFFYSCNSANKEQKKEAILIKNVRLIDGNGGAPIENTDILIIDGKIEKAGVAIDEKQAQVIDMQGKTIMPALISAHAHVGTLKGTKSDAANYTEENILSQLKKYQDYGVLSVLSMGTDRPLLFESGLRSKSVSGEMEGARLHTAGYGFGAPEGAPPLEFAMDKVFRPASASEVKAQFDSLETIQPEVIKIWVDDFNGKYKAKMSPVVYKAIIEEAHKRNLRVVSHVYYLSDLKQLVADGIDVIGHSVRSELIDDATIAEMKTKNIVYIPTLTLDEFAFAYAENPVWINTYFFRNALEPGVLEMISAEKYKTDIKNAPAYNINIRALTIAQQNLKKVFDAGIMVAMGTDSGAMALRAQGFSEHRELQLMVAAGLTPLQAITIATKNAATMLQKEKELGTLEAGKIADFIVLNANPAEDITNTQKIFSVYKAGKEVSKGPLSSK